MKKIISSIMALVVLFFVYIGLSWYAGRMYINDAREINNQLNSQIKNYLQQYELGNISINIKMSEIKSGIFSSQATYIVDLAGEQIPFDVDVKHGPIIGFSLGKYQAHYTLQKNEKTDIVFKAFDGKSPFDLTQKVSYGKGMHLDFKINPLLFSQGGVKIDFSGYQINLDTDKDFSFINGKGQLDKLVLDFNSILNTQFELQGVKEDYALTAAESNRYFVGKSSASIEKVLLKSFDRADIEINNIQLSANQEEKNKLVDGQYAIGVDSIKNFKEDFGKLILDIVIQKFDFNKFYENYGKLLSHKYDNTVTSKILLSLLQSEPIIQVKNLEWQMPKGTSSLSYALEFKNIESTEQKNLSEIKMEDVVKSMSTKIHLSTAMIDNVFDNLNKISKDPQQVEAVKVQFNQAINTLLQKKLLQQVDDGYRADVSYTNGKFNINGQEYSEEDLRNMTSAPGNSDLKNNAETNDEAKIAS